MVILGLLMVAGLGFRLRGTDVRMMDHDEAFSWRVATRPFWTMVDQVAGDTHPLLHFLVLKGVLRAGWTSVLALRLPSIAVGVATIWVVHGLSLAAIRYAGRRDALSDRRAGWAALAAAAYVTIHPYHIAVSGTARMYSFATGFAALSSWLLIEALAKQPPSRRLYVGYAVVVALMLHSHNFGVFVFAAQVGFALLEAWLHRPAAARLRYLAGAVVLAGLLYAPWIPAFLAQAKRVHDGFWIPPLTGETFGEILVNVAFGRDIVDRPTGVVLVCLVLIGLGWAVARLGGARPWILPAQVVAVWVMAVLISTIGGRPILQERYLVLALPAFTGWFALALANTRPRSASGLLAVALLLPTGYALGQVVAWPWRPPLSTFEAIAYLREVGRRGDVVLVNRPGIVNTMRYYQGQVPGPDLDVRYVLDPTELRRVGQASHLSSFDPGEAIDADRFDDLDARRLWVLNNARDLRGSGWIRQGEMTFGTDRGEFMSGLQLICYNRIAAEAPDRGGPR